MSAYTIINNIKWDDAFFASPARAGADTYSITAGKTLTIDTDTRTCQNSSETKGCAGTITLSSGDLFIDGTAVRLVPFDAGAGTCPAKGSILYFRSGGVDVASGECLGVWQTLASAPKTHGADAVPTTGYLKMRSLGAAVPDNSEVRTASGGGGSKIGDTNGADSAGWLEIVGVDGSTIVSSFNLQTFSSRGQWFTCIPRSSDAVCGQTDGVAATTYQLPASYVNTYHGGVQVETAVGSGVYEWWPNASTLDPARFANDARGMVCYINTQGLLKFGQNHSAVNGGMLPESGRKIRIPNILFVSTTSAATSAYTVAANAPLNTGPNSRFKIDYSVLLDLEKLTGNLYLRGVYQSLKVRLADSAFLEEIYTAGSTNVDIRRVCVGIGDPATTLVGHPFYHTGAFGSTIEDCTGIRALAGSIFRILSGLGHKFKNIKGIAGFARAGNQANLFYVDGGRDLDIDGLTIIGGNVLVTGGLSIKLKNIKYADQAAGTTSTSNPCSLLTIGSGTSGVSIDGISWVTSGVNECHPYTSLMNLDRCTDITLRNVGSVASPLNLGTVNATGAQISHSGTQTVQRCKYDRVFTTDCRTALSSNGSNGGTGVSCALSSVGSSTYDSFNGLYHNSVMRGLFGDPETGNYNFADYFMDGFTSTTAGKIVVGLSPPLTGMEVSDLVVSTSGAVGFTGSTTQQSASFAAGSSITLKCPYKIRGYTGFNGAPTFTTYGTITNYTIEYSLDLGVTWKVASASNLNAEVLDPVLGFNFWVRMTCNVADVAQRLRFAMVTNATAQQNFYPLETVRVVDSGSLSGSSIGWYTPDDTALFGFTTTPGASCYYDNEDGTVKSGKYRVRKPGYVEFVGQWQERTSWFQNYSPYMEAKKYLVAQTAAYPLTSGTPQSIVGVAVNGAAKTITSTAQLVDMYDYSQWWSCQEANMLHAVPITSRDGASFSIPADWTVISTTLNASKTLAGGTLQMDSPGTYGINLSATKLRLTTTGTYDLGTGVFAGIITVDNPNNVPITVKAPAGSTFVKGSNPANTTIEVAANTLTIAASVSLVGAEIHIYDMDNTPAGSLGTRLLDIESCPGATTALPVAGGNQIYIQIMHTGYEEFGQAYTMPASSVTFTADLIPDVNA